MRMQLLQVSLTMPSWLTQFLEALTQALGVGENVTDPKQYDIKEFKRLKYQLEAAYNYVFVDEKSGQYKDLPPEKLADLKLHFRKRIFDSE